MTAPAYNDPTHRAAVDWLRRHPTRCRCGRLAVDVDHDPPLALHDHVRGSGCCLERPACHACNRGAGRAIAAARRQRAPRARASRPW